MVVSFDVWHAQKESYTTSDATLYHSQPAILSPRSCLHLAHYRVALHLTKSEIGVNITFPFLKGQSNSHREHNDESLVNIMTVYRPDLHEPSEGDVRWSEEHDEGLERVRCIVGHANTVWYRADS